MPRIISITPTTTKGPSYYTIMLPNKREKRVFGGGEAIRPDRIAKGVDIETDEGLVEVEAIGSGDKIRIRDEMTGDESGYQQVKGVDVTSEPDVTIYEIRLDNQSVLKLNADHLVLTGSGWVMAKDLTMNHVAIYGNKSSKKDGK